MPTFSAFYILVLLFILLKFVLIFYVCACVFIVLCFLRFLGGTLLSVGLSLDVKTYYSLALSESKII